MDREWSCERGHKGGETGKNGRDSVQTAGLCASSGQAAAIDKRLGGSGQWAHQAVQGDNRLNPAYDYRVESFPCAGIGMLANQCDAEVLA